MDSLMGSLETLCNNVGEQLGRVQHFKKRLREAGIKANTGECEDILSRAVAEFKKKFNEDVKELCRDTDVEVKLAEMKTLIQENKEENEGANLEEGYRSQGPNDDIIAHLKSVQDNYKDAVGDIYGDMDDKENEKEAKLREKMAKIQALRAEIFALMNN